MAETVREIIELGSLNIRTFKVYRNLVALDGDDSTAPLLIPAYPDRTIQVLGTFDGGVVTIQGANDPTADSTTPVKWSTCHDPGGTALTFSSAGIKQLLENPTLLRALVSSGGVSTSLFIWITCKRS